MRLSEKDKTELLKAALEAPDLEGLRGYVLSVVKAIDSLPDNKSDAPAPPFRPVRIVTLDGVHTGVPSGNGLDAWNDGQLRIP